MLHLKQVLRVKKEKFQTMKTVLLERKPALTGRSLLHPRYLSKRSHKYILVLPGRYSGMCTEFQIHNHKKSARSSNSNSNSCSNSNILVTLEKLFLVKDGVGTNKIHTWSPLCRNLLAHLITLNEVFPKKQF